MHTCTLGVSARVTTISGVVTRHTLSVAVSDFYDRVLRDAALAPFFEGVDLARLRRHQVDFLLLVLEVGPDRHTPEEELGARLEVAHADLRIDDAAFERIVDHLAGALGDVGLADVELGRALSRVERLRAHVVMP